MERNLGATVHSVYFSMLRSRRLRGGRATAAATVLFFLQAVLLVVVQVRADFYRLLGVSRDATHKEIKKGPWLVGFLPVAGWNAPVVGSPEQRRRTVASFVVFSHPKPALFFACVVYVPCCLTYSLPTEESRVPPGQKQR